jgi:3-hydroxyanthranilate 3,4-dioxygenase
MQPLLSRDLWTWIEENRQSFEPPVGNKVIWEDSQFTAMVIRGPNRRRDFHDDPSDEIFYQLKGTMTLEYIDRDGQRQEAVIREGEMLLAPAHTPHAPHRPPDTWGLVIEIKRGPRDRLRPLQRRAAPGDDERDGHRARPARGHRGVRRQRGPAHLPRVRPRPARTRAHPHASVKLTADHYNRLHSEVRFQV